MTPKEFESWAIGTRVRFTDHTGKQTLGTIVYEDQERGVRWDSGECAFLSSMESDSYGLRSWLDRVDIPSQSVDVPRKLSDVEKIDGMVVSTDTHCYHLIPQIAMQRLCERISLGEQTKGKDAWNAMSENQIVLDSRKALARRFGHLINHSYRLLGKIETGEGWTEDDEREASAVMWGGMFAICAIAAQRKKQT